MEKPAAPKPSDCPRFETLREVPKPPPPSTRPPEYIELWPGRYMSWERFMSE